MIKLAEHRPKLGGIILLLFFLSNSGFTSTLHLCVMQAAACCEPAGAQRHDACDEILPASAGLSVSNALACHVDRVVGGLNGVQGLLEKNVQDKPQHVQLPVVVLPNGVVLISSAQHGVHLALDSHHSPPLPSVEKYVLNETFLI